MEQDIESKKLVQVLLEGEMITKFNSLKQKLGFKNESEVLRWSIKTTDEMTK